jgi:hypothetical protein
LDTTRISERRPASGFRLTCPTGTAALQVSGNGDLQLQARLLPSAKPVLHPAAALSAKLALHPPAPDSAKFAICTLMPLHLLAASGWPLLTEKGHKDGVEG